MARITNKERDFWMNYFRQQIQKTISKYRQENSTFLVQELPKQAEAKASEQLGIVALLADEEKLNKAIDIKNRALDTAKTKLQEKYHLEIKPLEESRDKLKAKRVSKVLTGRIADWPKYIRPRNQPYQYDGALRDAVAVAEEELYKQSEAGQHLGKLDQQYYDVPVALMLATSRLEMANAVRQLAVTIGIDLPALTALEDLT